MKGKNLNFGMSALFIALALLFAPHKIQAQAQNQDSVQVDLRYPVTIGQKTLQPGTYMIEELNIAGGNSPALVIRAEDGTKVETITQIAPVRQTRTQRATRVTFYQIDGNYYINTIWVKGWTYGYKFALPKDVNASKAKTITQ